MNESELGYCWDVEEVDTLEAVLIDLGDKTVHLTKDDLIEMLESLGRE